MKQQKIQTKMIPLQRMKQEDTKDDTTRETTEDTSQDDTTRMKPQKMNLRKLH